MIANPGDVRDGCGYTMEDAYLVAEGIKVAFQGVESIEVFGSIARGEMGFDIDLLIHVNDDVSEKFFRALRGTGSGYHCSRGRRFQVVFEGYGNYVPPVLVCREFFSEEPEEDDAFHKACHCIYRYMLDVFLVPVDWRNRLQELQSRLPHRDPNFMRNIARDAKVVA